ncbi:MAG: GNAT family N-acetyltransferase [Capsulimonadales bacterium]|nr:GNAT family N-acetyltransferase [Capsulimonadales bacterium]
MILFQTTRLLVRSIDDADLDDLHRLFGNPDVTRRMGDGQPLERTRCAEWIAVTRRNYRTKGFGLSLVTDRSTGQTVGACGIVYAPDRNQPEILYAFFPEVRNRGYGGETAAALLDYGFRHFHLPRILATIRTDHSASRKIAERCGMTLDTIETDEDGSQTAVYSLANPGLAVRRLDNSEMLDDTRLSGLCRVLIDTVNGGASVGFLPPLAHDTAPDYWNAVRRSLGSEVVLWIAEQNGEILGTVQLHRCPKENGRHRAEIAKMIVHPEHRNRGIASALLGHAERFARNDGRTTLVLDTEAGSDAEFLYRKNGWQRVGEIPEYALNARGERIATAYYYKLLPE